jgi:DNA-binding NarL/FixJ family response regulator
MLASQSDEVRTLVVDDQEAFRDVMRRLLAVSPGFTLVGEAPSGEDAIAAVETLNPRLVLMDVRMPGMGGLCAARVLGELHPEVVVVLISVHGDEELPRELVAGNATVPFVRKQELRPSLLKDLWERYRAD